MMEIALWIIALTLIFKGFYSTKTYDVEIRNVKSQLERIARALERLEDEHE